MQSQEVNVVQVTKSTPELLSPAGDWDAMRAAVANGADAVYFGLSDFNARHRANNFKVEELPEVMAYLHSHNVRAYVALNTLIFSDELEQLAKLVAAIAAAGVDAVIVQDLGLVRLIRKIAPNLGIHGSTQMTLTEPIGIDLVQTLGVSRVILARELSIDDIRRIKQQTSMPVEVFIHGALCVAYSGQCLTSEAMGGRSANRGQCAQACRLPYELIVDGQPMDLGDRSYLLSPQDLAAPDLVKDLADVGVASLKIEGRLKSGQYVAAATRTYRQALDAAAKDQGFVPSDQQAMDLQQSFSRGFGHGFLDGVDHQLLVEGRFPKHRGVRVGMVHAVGNGAITIKLDRPDVQLVAGDGIVFDEGHPEQDEQGGRVMTVQAVDENGVIVRGLGAGLSQGKTEGNRFERRDERFGRDERGGRDARNSGSRDDRRGAQGPDISRFAKITRSQIEATRKQQQAKPSPYTMVRMFGEQVNLRAIGIGAIVWRTDDPRIRRRLEQTYNRDVIVHRVALDATLTAVIGQKLILEFAAEDGRKCRVESESPVEAARKYPLTDQVLREQLDRLGNTPFGLRHVKILDEAGKAQSTIGVMVPRSVLGDMRHRAIDAIMGGAVIESSVGVAPDPVGVLKELRKQRMTDLGASFSKSARLSGAESEEGLGKVAGSGLTAELASQQFTEPVADPTINEPIAQPLEGDALASQSIAAMPASAENATSDASIAQATSLSSASNSVAKIATTANTTIGLSVLVRSMDQLRAAIDWRSEDPIGRVQTIYCEFEDVRGYREAIHLCRKAGVTVGLASTRIIKPGEHGLLNQIALLKPDRILCRSLAALAFFREALPGVPLVADYSFNIANELAAEVIASCGASILTPSYDLNWPQMKLLLQQYGPRHFEVVVHQHMPMFHMEHCVFAHVLSEGKDYRDCGRPCESHDVRLGERGQQAHPLKADVGCRNTLYNATPQSAAPLIWQMLDLDVRHYRVELLAEKGEDVAGYLDRYASILLRKENGRQSWRQLKVLNQLGVTTGTLAFE